MMRSANPALNKKTFQGIPRVTGKAAMTIDGTVNKTAIMLLLVVMTASWTWSRFFAAGPQAVMGLMIFGAIAGLVIGIVTVFKRTAAPITAPLYAAFEGLFLGGLSAMLESRYPGIVIQAVGLTFGTLFCLLGAYKSRLIKVTENFRLGVVAATGGIALLYFASFILGFFGINIPMIHSSGPIGIGFSLVVVTIAALNLVMDFDFIETASDRGAPKYMEWYGAFGLMVTLIWLYIEFLRLLTKLRSR